MRKVRAEFTALLDMLLDHVEDGLGQAQLRPGMEAAIEAENVGLDRRIAKIPVGAGPIAFEEFAHFQAILRIEENHLGRNAHGVGVARRFVGGHPVDEHFGAFARHLDEIAAPIAGNLDQPVLIHQSADQRGIVGLPAVPFRHPSNGAFDIAFVDGCRLSELSANRHAILRSASPKRGSRTAIRQRTKRQLANL